MRANVRMTTDTLLVSQWQRRQDEMNLLARIRDRQSQRDGDLELVGMLVVFGILFTAVVLAIWLPGAKG